MKMKSIGYSGGEKGLLVVLDVRDCGCVVDVILWLFGGSEGI